VGQKRGRSNVISTHQYKDMDNQPTFAERTKQLKEIAFQLKNAAEFVLAEVQHMEAAQERFAQKAKAKAKTKPRA
jgi:2C-methyl-D-erythritol 2,4-cyclodiphosphate synthase